MLEFAKLDHFETKDGEKLTETVVFLEASILDLAYLKTGAEKSLDAGGTGAGAGFPG